MDRSVPSILTARGIYALQWYFLSPVLLTIASAMGVGASSVGLVPFFFILGAATAQIPAGILSTRYSAKLVYVVGLSLLSLADVILALSTSFGELLLLRLISGIGAGFFFSPAAAVLLKSRENRAGLIMGIYNTAFDVGGALGLIWGVPDVALGWRAATMLGGSLGLILAFENLFVVQNRARTPGARPALTLELPVIVLGLSTAGFWGTTYAAGTLMASYAELVYGASPSIAGVLTSVYFLGSVFGGLASVLYDKSKRKGAFIVVMIAVTAACYFLIGFGLYGMIAAMSLTGFFGTAATSSYYARTSSVSKNFSLGLSMVNFLNMVTGMWISPLFSHILVYSVSSIPEFLAAASLLPLSLWLLPKKIRGELWRSAQ
ncbi:MAG: MFS transporter [TACK group archaeon]|nr:MFS transporter [TACK group archaeon]